MDTCHWDDVSHYQGAFKPSRAVCAKATEGTTNVDGEYADTKKRALAGDHHFFAYHFLKAGNAVAQAQHAHSVVGSVPLMVDVESEGSSHPGVTDVAQFVAAYRKGGGVANLIYLPHWYWQGIMHSESMASLAKLGLWNINSDYSGGENNSPAFASFGGVKVAGLQYTSTPHDMNVARMSFTDLWAIITGKPPVIAPDHANGSRTLELVVPQMHGDDVKYVQQHIGEKKAGKADGIFGPGTKSGVIWWQQQHKLTPDGEVGPITWASLGVKHAG